MDDILVPTSPGELIDKLTILRLKSERIADPERLAHVRHEKAVLEETARAHLPETGALSALWQALYEVNAVLWEVEDDIRVCEREGRFDARFVELARSVYVTNDRRAALKKEINLLLGSALVEEKSYADYGPGPA